MICFGCGTLSESYKDEQDTQKNLVDYEAYTGNPVKLLTDVMGKPCKIAKVPLCDKCLKRFNQKMNMKKARAARKPKGDK